LRGVGVVLRRDREGFTVPLLCPNNQEYIWNRPMGSKAFA
jgi:hypothetical protein